MFSLACKVPKTTPNFCTLKFCQKKYGQTTCIFWSSSLLEKSKLKQPRSSTRELTSIKVRENNLDFLTIKKTSKKVRGYFDQQNYNNKKNTWEQHGFFDYQNYIEKSTWQQRTFFDQQNYIKKAHENDVEVRRNLVFHVSASNQCWFDVVCLSETDSSKKSNISLASSAVIFTL